MKDLRSANSRKDCGRAGHNPRNCHRFFCRRCQKISKVPTGTGMVGVLIPILVTVTIFDVANVESANAHKPGGCPTHDPRIVVAFDVADPQTANNHRDGACTPPPRPRGEGKDLNDLARMVTGIEGRQPPTLQGDGGGLTV